MITQHVAPPFIIIRILISVQIYPISKPYLGDTDAVDRVPYILLGLHTFYTKTPSSE
jgi:hypothetical protein